MEQNPSTLLSSTLLGETADELAKLDPQIIEAALDLAELKAKRTRRTEMLKSIRGVISPIRRFPPELLAEIFDYCREASLIRGSCTTLNAMEAPIVLSHVCSFWRAVSLSTPKLWDTVHIDNGCPPCDVLEPRLLEVAEKSRNLPISLSIDTVTFWPFPRRNPLPDLSMNVLWPFRKRLQSLSLLISAQEDDILHLPSSTIFPMLTSLVIEVHGSITLDIASILAKFCAPTRLEHFEVWAEWAPPTTGSWISPGFSWAALKSLRVHTPVDVFVARDILTQCKQLAACIMADLLPGDADQADLPLCVLPNMTSFMLTANGNISSLFQPFSFPNLKVLHISDETRWPFQLLVDLHTRSGFELQELELEKPIVDADRFISFLPVLATLSTLSVRYWDGINNRFFDALNHKSLTGAKGIVLPHLTNLTLAFMTEDREGDAFSRMVQSLRFPDDSGNRLFPLLERIELSEDGWPCVYTVETQPETICAAERSVDYRHVSQEPDDSD